MADLIFFRNTEIEGLFLISGASFQIFGKLNNGQSQWGGGRGGVAAVCGDGYGLADSISMFISQLASKVKEGVGSFLPSVQSLPTTGG
jgi:hypothetical protein